MNHWPLLIATQIVLDAVIIDGNKYMLQTRLLPSFGSILNDSCFTSL